MCCTAHNRATKNENALKSQKYERTRYPKKGEICICEYKLHTVDNQKEKKTALEAKYKTELAEHFGIVFNS